MFFEGFPNGRVHSGGTLVALGYTFGGPGDIVGAFQEQLGALRVLSWLH